NVYYVIVFTLAQLSWFSLLALWIYWYVSNYIIFTEIGEEVSAKLVSESANVGALVSGIILLVVISVAMSLIFIYLTRQMNITRLYDNFIANVTHELKSPLSSIQLYLETMNQRDIPEQTQKEFISVMLKDAERLNDLITSILDISGMEQKKLAYNYQVCIANEVLHRLIQEAISEFKVSKNAVTVKGSLDGQFVVDQRALKIAVNNLIHNAIKYSKESVQLEIQLSTTSNNFLIEFQDQGIGIEDKDKNKIFKKFQRVYNPKSPSVKGTGLGLYWVREIIKSHGGNITVFSAGQDAGSTFSIELPIYQTSKKRYINRLLKITQRRKRILETLNE
ncbi:sensor histidine kinase, partial [Bacteroidota bacterium]